MAAHSLKNSKSVSGFREELPHVFQSLVTCRDKIIHLCADGYGPTRQRAQNHKHDEGSGARAIKNAVIESISTKAKCVDESFAEVRFWSS